MKDQFKLSGELFYIFEVGEQFNLIRSDLLLPKINALWTILKGIYDGNEEFEFTIKGNKESSVYAKFKMFWEFKIARFIRNDLDSLNSILTEDPNFSKDIRINTILYKANLKQIEIDVKAFENLIDEIFKIAEDLMQIFSERDKLWFNRFREETFVKNYNVKNKIPKYDTEKMFVDSLREAKGEIIKLTNGTRNVTAKDLYNWLKNNSKYKGGQSTFYQKLKDDKIKIEEI